MMKRNLILLFLFSATSLIAQVDTLTVAHDHNLLEKKCDGAKCKYFVDNRQVNKAEYEKHINEPSIATCTPCYLKQLDDKGDILFEGDFYTDCCIGTYIERYSNGTIKIQGHYKVPTQEISGNELYNSRFCRRDGEWNYYKENGNLEKTEVYQDGVVVN